MDGNGDPYCTDTNHRIQNTINISLLPVYTLTKDGQPATSDITIILRWNIISHDGSGATTQYEFDYTHGSYNASEHPKGLYSFRFLDDNTGTTLLTEMTGIDADNRQITITIPTGDISKSFRLETSQIPHGGLNFYLQAGGNFDPRGDHFATVEISIISVDDLDYSTTSASQTLKINYVRDSLKDSNY